MSLHSHGSEDTHLPRDACLREPSAEGSVLIQGATVPHPLDTSHAVIPEQAHEYSGQDGRERNVCRLSNMGFHPQDPPGNDYCLPAVQMIPEPAQHLSLHGPVSILGQTDRI